VPRVVPSQVVAAIESLFGSDRFDADVESIRFMDRDRVRTLLALLDQIPGTLITAPFVEYTEYLQCQSALTSALSIWDVGDQDRPASGVKGRNPVQRIRQILELCPDEIPPPYPELTFIPQDARAVVQEHTRAAWIDFGAGDWTGATVFAATAVEALLYWTLKTSSDFEQPANFDKQHLPEYITAAKNCKVITEATAAQAHLATDARNLIHAGKMARTGLTCTKATALTGLAALEAVMGDLRRCRSP
jgi:hypothetical protein